MKTLKTIKLAYALALMSCVLAIVFCVTGNPFDAILTLKSAKRLNSLEYGGKMKITGVVFDRRASLYKAKLIDEGGNEGVFVYNPSDNTFTDCYKNDLVAVSTHLSRGRVIAALKSCGVFPEEVLVTVYGVSGFIGEARCSISQIKITIDTKDKESFKNEVFFLLSALDGMWRDRVDIMSETYFITLISGGISKNKKDIEARIKVRS